jgi:predicted permease
MTFDRWRYVLPLRIRSLFRSRQADRELADELQDYLERAVERNVERGMSPADARRAALRALGGADQVTEACRDARRVRFAENAVRDARYGLRLLGRSPIFTTVAVLSLALGIGANAAIFQLIDAIRLRTLPIANPHELAEVRPDGPQAFGNYDGINSRFTYPLWELIGTQQRAFSAMFAWGETELPVGHGADARRARGLWVSGDLFGVLGISAHRGRLLEPGDDRKGCGAGSAVVSHAFWQAHLNGRESAIGETLTVLDRPFTIVGVAPASFTGLEVGRTFDVAVPLCSAALWDPRIYQRDRWWLTVMGRLQTGWTIARANEHLRTLSPSLLDATIPPGYDAGLIDGYRGLRFGVTPAGRGVSRLRNTHDRLLSLLFGLTGLVLLITCGNLATLMLARASGRQREVAVRVAIGASRGRLVSQMLVESLLVAATGAALAIPVALLSGRSLVGFLDTPANAINLNLSMDWRLIGFVGAVAAAAAVLFGLLPALRASMADPIDAMRQASRGLTFDRHRARFQRGLVVVQIAVSLVLIFSALLFVQTFRNLAAVDTGFEADHTTVVSFVDRASQDLPPDRMTAFQEQLTSEIRSIPGIAAAASSTHVPLSGATWSHFFRVTGVAGTKRRVSRFAYVSPGYFETLQIPVRAGRDFGVFDNSRARRVMVVNDSFVRSHLGGLDPIGATVDTIAEAGFPAVTYEIIGVVGDTKYADVRDENCWCSVPGGSMAPIAYVPIAQNPSPYAWAPVILRSSAPLAGIAPAIARRVDRLNPSIAIQFVEMKAQVRARLVRERMIAWLAGAFGVLAMALVAVGLYGIIAYLAAGRRNEIGIRLALGSTRAQIVRLVLRDNLWLMGLGLATGLPLAVAAMRGAGTLLFGLTPMDVPTVVAAGGLLASVGVLAAVLPAWRAARTRPDEALRCE